MGQSGWVLVDGIKHPAKVNETGTVQMKGNDGCPADRRQSEDLREIFVPGEVLGPLIASRIEKINFVTSQWIDGGRPCGFMLITALTGEGQILAFGSSAERQGHNVVDRERVAGKSLLCAAILTAPLGTQSHFAAQVSRDVVRHVPGIECLADPLTPGGFFRGGAPSQRAPPSFRRAVPLPGR